MGLRVEGQADLHPDLVPPGDVPHPADNGHGRVDRHGRPWPQPADAPATGPDLLAGLRNGAWLDAQDFPPLRYAVPGLIPEGSTLFVGPPKIGKSWFVLACGLAVAAGGVALDGIPVEARPVLYLALEDGDRRLQDRCRQLLPGGTIPPSFEYMTEVMPGTAVATLAAWLARHPDAQPFVILDTLGKVMPPALGGESAYQRDYRIGSELKRLTDQHPGMSLLVNHHDRKAGAEDFVDAVSGTHGLAGAADTVVVLDRKRHEPEGLLKVTGRDVAEGEYAVRFDAGAAWRLQGHSLEDAAAMATQHRATAGVGDRSAEVIAYVGEHPDGVRASDVEDALGADARRYLARLVDAGRLVRVRRGVYAPLPNRVPSVPTSQVEAPEWDNGTHGTPSEGGTASGWSTADTMRDCVDCGHPALLRDLDGRPRHKECPL